MAVAEAAANAESFACANVVNVSLIELGEHSRVKIGSETAMILDVAARARPITYRLTGCLNWARPPQDCSVFGLVITFI